MLAYADDFVLCAPTWKGLQCLINILANGIDEINMTCNVRKTVCMIFQPKDRLRRINSAFPNLQFGCDTLAIVNNFKYLGHIITDDLRDDLDMQREMRNLFVRTNILKCKFAKCSVEVKVSLFKAYCICLYGSALWKSHSYSSLNKLHRAYHKCIKIFFGYKRQHSISMILINLGLPSFDTIIINSRLVLKRSISGSNNKLVNYLNAIDLLC